MNADNTMKTTAKPPKHDWSRYDAMSDAQRNAAATHDPEVMPLTPADFKRMKRTALVKLIRRALGLTQEEFAGRFHIPLGTLRDWEQGAAVPDQSARAYLTVIARDPEAVRKALSAMSLTVGSPKLGAPSLAVNQDRRAAAHAPRKQRRIPVKKAKKGTGRN
jgi:putative transcriptional regulator